MGCRLTARELTEAMKHLEVMLISLHKVGSYYDDDQAEECDAETIMIIDGFGYARRLAAVRATLSKAASRSLEKAAIDNLEEVLGRVRVWRKPGDAPKVQWRRGTK